MKPQETSTNAKAADLSFLGPAWTREKDYTAADFRSDIVTKPTIGMLHAALGASLADAFDESPSPLECQMAKMTGHEEALFLISGTMANQVALRTHTIQAQAPMGILVDHRSHILHKECGGMATIGGALIQSVVPSNGLYLTLDDVCRCIVLEDDFYCATTRVLSLENPHSGTIMPLDEFRAIARYARAHGVRVHLDGARLWEVHVAGAGTLKDYCSEVDSVSMCFTKGLCAPAGSILVASKTFIRQARKVRKSIGGSMRQPGINIAMAAAGLAEVFDNASENSLLRKGHALAKELSQCWIEFGGKIAMPVQTNMVVLALDANGISEKVWVDGGNARGLILRENRLVLHCQIERRFIDILRDYMRDTLQAFPQIVKT